MGIKSTFIKIYTILIVFFFCKTLHAQSLSVGTPVLEDYYRREQLLGKIDSNLSFSVRPLYPIKSTSVNDVFDPYQSFNKDNWDKAQKLTFAADKGSFQILPLIWRQQFNSNHPYGWNNGLMIPARGIQSLVSGGFFFKLGPLTVQFLPEYVYAANNAFAGYASGHGDQDLIAYYSYHNLIDNPERYGNAPFTRASLGQSSIRLTFGAISFGLSNENLWWGPGIRNDLILTNNAPGFKHVTINTVKPFKTFLGSFEGQIIGARLDGTKLTQLPITTTSTGINLFDPPRDDWRYYTGLNINYQPKWIPGLFLGLIRSFNAYHSDVKTLSEYIPFFFPYLKASINPDGQQGDPIPRDQVTSVYARWLFNKANAEIYFEYGLNDNSYNLSDFIGSPEHSRTYIIGLRKMIALADRPGESILFSGEITQMSQSVDRIVRGAGGWYIHGEVRQGMTNYGKVIGAGTGSGGNLQSTDISWVKGLKKLGVMFERYEHDVDFYQEAFPDINGHSRKWVDFGFGLQGAWNYKNFLIDAKLEGVESLNYEWILKNYTPDIYYIPNNNVFNLHIELGTMYRF